MFVNTALVTVIFVAAKLADETNEDATKDEVVTPEEKRAVPDTSSVNPGAVVPIPTFPPVVKIDPIVLLLPIAANVLEIFIEPAETLVSIRLVVVTLTVVMVPPTIKLPERLILPPVNVVPEMSVDVSVVNVPDVANTLPEVMPLEILSVPMLEFVIARLVIVLLVAFNAPAEILVFTNTSIGTLLLASSLTTGTLLVS